MDYKIAFEILQIDTTEVGYNDITLKYLKKKYHKLALQNHPDKNGNTPESNYKFKQINEAYNYLQNEIQNINPKPINEYSDNDDNESSLYIDILHTFMKSVMEGKFNKIISTIVKEIVTGAKKVSLKLFDEFDKDTLVNLYFFLSKHKTVLHLNNNILEEILNIVIQKNNNVQMYYLNPSINDLFNNNVYKLYVDNELLLVPLWYNEMYFETNGREIIVNCEPELPEGMDIDENNNIYIQHKIIARNELLDLIMNCKDLKICVGTYDFYIPISELKMKTEQYYRIKNKGITKTTSDISDIYNVSEKADIIVKINIIQ